MNSFALITALAAFAGLCLSLYIANTKRMARPLVCPIGGHCDAVTHSSFSTFLGIPLERLGIAYYGLATTAYLTLGVFPALLPSGAVFFVYIVTVLAFFFSLYLTFIQAFVIRKWCTWCLFSAGITALMFFVTAATTSLDWALHVGEALRLLQFAAILGLVLGVGGTTIADMLFFSFLKDLRISAEESAILKTVTQVTWVGLALLIFSSGLVYLGFPALLTESVVHTASVLFLLIILANAIFLNLLVAPQLTKISFGSTHEHHAGELIFLRRFSFALLAVSLVTWYALFAAYFFGDAITSFAVLVGWYGLALLAALLIMLRVDERLAQGKEAE